MIRSVVLCLDNHKGITRPNTITFLSVLQSSLLKNGLFLCDNVEIITPIFLWFPWQWHRGKFCQKWKVFCCQSTAGSRVGLLVKDKIILAICNQSFPFSKNNRHFQKLCLWQYSQSLGKLVNESCFESLASFFPINLLSLYSQRIYR